MTKGLKINKRSEVVKLLRFVGVSLCLLGGRWLFCGFFILLLMPSTLPAKLGLSVFASHFFFAWRPAKLLFAGPSHFASATVGHAALQTCFDLALAHCPFSSQDVYGIASKVAF